MSSGAETPSNRPIFMPPEGAPKVVAAIVGVMRDIPKIQKTGTNREHKYNFVEATVLTALVQDQMQKHGLVINPREISRTVQSGIMFIKYEYDLYCEEQAIINAGSCTGSCRFEFKSGSADDKAVSKCYTSALKTYQIGVFRIPADVDDIERDRDPTPAARRGGGNGEDREEAAAAPPRTLKDLVQLVRDAADMESADEVLRSNAAAVRGREHDVLFDLIREEYQRRWGDHPPIMPAA